MAPLSFTVATLNTGLVRVAALNIDLQEPIPARRERQRALPSLIREANHDLLCLQEVYSREQQLWLKRALQGSAWQVVCSTSGTWPGRRNWGLVSLVRRDLFQITERRFIRFQPADWTEAFIAAKGAMAVYLNPVNGHQGFWLVNLHATYGGLKNDFAGPFATALRSRQIHQIGTDFGDQAALIVGDFNCGPHVCQTAYDILHQNYQAQDLVAPGSNHAAYRTWDPSNPLHNSALRRDGTDHDAHHGRIDHLWGTPRLLNSYVAAQPRLIWHQAVVRSAFAFADGYVCPSDHYGLELCMTAR